MSFWWILPVGLGAVWAVALWVNRRAVRQRHCSGDPDLGIILFVEPIRWLFIFWGFVSFCRGLRRGGYRGQVRLFRWCTGAGSLLVVLDLLRQRRLLGKAEKLARQIEVLSREDPGRSIHVVGYSSGCYVALEAMRRLQHADAVQTVVLLAGSVSPRYPLVHLAGKVRAVYSFHSCVDLIVGIGTVLFGCNDRRCGPGCGSVGFKNPPPFVTQRAWRLADIRRSYLGDHFTVTSPEFVSCEVTPLIMEASSATTMSTKAMSR